MFRDGGNSNLKVLGLITLSTINRPMNRGERFREFVKPADQVCSLVLQRTIQPGTYSWSMQRGINGSPNLLDTPKVLLNSRDSDLLFLNWKHRSLESCHDWWHTEQVRELWARMIQSFLLDDGQQQNTVLPPSSEFAPWFLPLLWWWETWIKTCCCTYNLLEGLPDMGQDLGTRIRNYICREA